MFNHTKQMFNPLVSTQMFAPLCKGLSPNQDAVQCSQVEEKIKGQKFTTQFVTTDFIRHVKAFRDVALSMKRNQTSRAAKTKPTIKKSSTVLLFHNLTARLSADMTMSFTSLKATEWTGRS